MDIDDDALRSAVDAHKDDIKAKGEKCFSRRRVILIADLFGMKPMPMVWQMEKRGLLKRGSYEWFKRNGGITWEQVCEVRNDIALERGEPEALRREHVSEYPTT